MSEASFASLGPTLLARKGGAKPAMRPQLAPLPGVVPPEADELEDLGWNDMGGESPEQADQAATNIVAIKPSAKANAAEGGLIADGRVAAGANDDPADDISDQESPLVKRQQERLAQQIQGENAAQANPVQSKPARRATKTSRRTAFTLRLDADRHLKLRLASTMQGVSAQALVTQALDALLGDIDDLDALADRMKRT
jgi:hypothetical protein